MSNRSNTSMIGLIQAKVNIVETCATVIQTSCLICYTKSYSYTISKCNKIKYMQLE